MVDANIPDIALEPDKTVKKIMDRFKEYDVFVQEIHHIHKIDSPSGTAITLANQFKGKVKKAADMKPFVDKAKAAIAWPTRSIVNSPKMASNCRL